MVGIQAKLKLVKFYRNFSRYNFEKLIRTLSASVAECLMIKKILAEYVTYIFAYIFIKRQKSITFYKFESLGSVE